MKYDVTFSFPADYTVEVNADSEEDAIALAEDKFSTITADFMIYDAVYFDCEKAR